MSQKAKIQRFTQGDIKPRLRSYFIYNLSSYTFQQDPKSHLKGKFYARASAYLSYDKTRVQIRTHFKHTKTECVDSRLSLKELNIRKIRQSLPTRNDAEKIIQNQKTKLRTKMKELKYELSTLNQSTQSKKIKQLSKKIREMSHVLNEMKDIQQSGQLQKNLDQIYGAPQAFKDKKQDDLISDLGFDDNDNLAVQQEFDLFQEAYKPSDINYHLIYIEDDGVHKQQEMMIEGTYQVLKQNEIFQMNEMSQINIDENIQIYQHYSFFESDSPFNYSQIVRQNKERTYFDEYF